VVVCKNRKSIPALCLVPKGGFVKTVSTHFASESCATLAHDRRIHPRKATNHRGGGSEAEWLLKLDMNEDTHKRMQPKEVYLSRMEYFHNYPLRVFLKRSDQEERRRKFIVYFGNT
jgi:hypothetical protein